MRKTPSDHGTGDSDAREVQLLTTDLCGLSSDFRSLQRLLNVPEAGCWCLEASVSGSSLGTDGECCCYVVGEEGRAAGMNQEGTSQEGTSRAGTSQEGLSKIFKKKEEAGKTTPADFGATLEHSAQPSVTVLERDAARQSHLDEGPPVCYPVLLVYRERGWSLGVSGKRSWKTLKILSVPGSDAHSRDFAT
jgi:hypothetical protein